jgi:hypothetical protein
VADETVEQLDHGPGVFGFLFSLRDSVTSSGDRHGSDLNLTVGQRPKSARETKAVTPSGHEWKGIHGFIGRDGARCRQVRESQMGHVEEGLKRVQ